MTKSMTAFAQAEGSGPWGTLSWELRMVNHRYLEVAARLPEALRSLEGPLRERAGGYLKRGKLDVGLRYRAELAGGEFQVHTALVTQLMAAADEVAGVLGHATGLDTLEVLRWPGVLDTPGPDLEPVRAQALDLLEQALAELVEGRVREGGKLRRLVLERCDAMDEQVARARRRMPVVVAAVRERLRRKVAEAAGGQLDPERLEQELAMLAQRLDVDEEMDRLGAHLEEVRRVLDDSGPVGRRLDFLMQELNREANTLGSKSADVETTRVSVEMKVLIEQMREQIQNIE